MIKNIFKINKYALVAFALVISGCQTSVTVSPSSTPSANPSATVSPTASPSIAPTTTPVPSESPTTGTRKESFDILQNSMIQDGKIVAGSKTVFRYTLSVDPIPMAVDDEYADMIIFEISSDEKDTFTYENADLAKINAYTMHSCFCPPEITNPKQLLKGKITGTKIDSQTWKVDSTNDLANFSGEFKVK